MIDVKKLKKWPEGSFFGAYLFSSYCETSKHLLLLRFCRKIAVHDWNK